MGWTGLPVAASPTYQDVQDFKFLIQFIYAIRERNAVLTAGNSQLIWPPPVPIWDSGTVADITDNGDGTLTITMEPVDWTTDSDAGCTSQRWIDYSCPSCDGLTLSYIPTNYDIIIEGSNTDQFTVVRGTITSQTFEVTDEEAGTGTGTVNVSDLVFKNAIAADFIPSLSYLVGKNWYFIKQDGVWSSDRQPTKPNDFEYWRGIVASGMLSGANGTLQEITSEFAVSPYYSTTPPAVAWSPNQGHPATGSPTPSYECMCYTSDGYLHRLPIASNNANTLIFGNGVGSGGLSLAGNYSIIIAGTKCNPNRRSDYPMQFYAGAGENYISHDVNDSIGQATLPAYTVNWDEGDPCTDGCDDASHNTLDIDAQYEIDNQCVGSQAGDFVAPGYFKSWRALQNEVLGLGPSYVLNSWDGGNGVVPYLYPARLLYTADVNGWTCGGTYETGTKLGVSVDIDPPRYPWPVYYYVEGTDANGTVTIAEGQGTLTDDATLSGGGFSDVWITIVVWLSYGFTRYFPRTFRYLYDKTCFIPDCDSGCTDPAAIEDYDSTGCLGVGQWIIRPTSTNYSESANGFTGESIPFIAGDYARYDGDNFADPFSGTGAETTATEETPYWQHFFRGEYANNAAADRRDSQTGIVSASTAYSITDTKKNWFTDVAYNTGTMRIQGGEATGGDASSLTDANSQTGEAFCFWQSSRFVNIEPYQTFVLEIYKSSLPTGWTIADDGTATFAAPTAPGNMGTHTAGATPTISAVGPAAISAIHYPQVVWIDGNNFDSSATIDLVNTTTTTTYSNVAATSIGPGEIVLAPMLFDAGDWTATVTNHDAGGPYVSDPCDFTVNSVYWVPVTGSAGAVLSFATVDGLTVAAGDGYLVREPSYEINKWKNRQLVSISTTGDSISVPILGNDNDTLYFAAQDDAPAPGSTYAIVEYETGTVWEFSTTAPASGINVVQTTDDSYWVVPTGADPRTSGVDFLPDQSANLPTCVKSYGFVEKGDYMESPAIYNELYRVINQLTRTFTGLDWRNIANDSSLPENNNGASSGYDCDFGTAVSDAQGDFGWTTSVDGAAPYGNGASYYDGSYGIGLDAQWAYPEAMDLPKVFTPQVTFYAFSPFIPDFVFCSLHIDDEGNPDQCSDLIKGIDDWTGGQFDLTYNGWKNIGSGSIDAEDNAFGMSLGKAPPNDPLDCLEEIDISCDPPCTACTITPGLGTGYEISNQISILDWGFTYTG